MRPQYHCLYLLCLLTCKPPQILLFHFLLLTHLRCKQWRLAYPVAPIIQVAGEYMKINCAERTNAVSLQLPGNQKMSLFWERRLENSQESAGGLRNGLFYDRSFSIRWRFIAHLTLMIATSPINRKKTGVLEPTQKIPFLF